MGLFDKVFGSSSDRELKKIEPIVKKVNEIDLSFDKLSNEELKSRSSQLKTKIRSIKDKDEQKKALDRALPEAFAIVKNACKRLKDTEYEIAGAKEKWHMVPFDEQIIGGIVLHQGKIAEMKTGEGKTLAATMPVYLNALSGRGSFVVTVNEYLATRDAEWMGLIYKFLGLTVGSIKHGQTTDEKREAYNSDVTYGTNNEFGFDYLRDNMVQELSQMVQRPEMNYAIVDEVDSILIDEARTPLIISAPDEESGKMYQQFAQILPRLRENEHYNIDEKHNAATLTEKGIDEVEQLLGVKDIYSDKGVGYVHHLEQALRAHVILKRDKDYVVRDGEILIVDQFTGRIMPGRRFSEGLHQAIEAKEGVPVQKESKTLATITFQNLFRMFDKLAGMTGTAMTQEEEFQKVYGLLVVEIPTHKPMVRNDLADRIYKTEKGKFIAATREIKKLHEKGQPVLVGTIAIEKSEELSGMLKREGIPHEVLNAKQHEREAHIVANAGQKGAVTIATNMAGRGTDIKLGEGVKDLGGLFILGTERHEARRIDNQLRGRAGRQGDPGASQFYVSTEDELMRRFGSERMKGVMDTFKIAEDEPIESGFISKQIEASQKRVEGHNFDLRRYVLQYDDVMNTQRETVYRKRREAIDEWEGVKKALKKGVQPSELPTKLKENVQALIKEEIENFVQFHTPESPSPWNLEEIVEVANTIYKLPNDAHRYISGIRDKGRGDEEDARKKIVQYLFDGAKKTYAEREQKMGADKMRMLEKMLILRTIDTLWIEHLDAMEALRGGIGLRGYGQRDPLVEYKKEGYSMFKKLLAGIRTQVVYNIFKLEIVSQKKSPMEDDNKRYSGGDDTAGSSKDTSKKQKDKVGRNDPCPCGSGKKYKKCCGK